MLSTFLNVHPVSTEYIAGARPVGLVAAYSAQLLGVAFVIVSDLNSERLAQARSIDCETVNLSEHPNLGEQIEQILGTPEVDCAVDCVGFEASAHGTNDADLPPHTYPWNCTSIVRFAQWRCNFLYVLNLLINGEKQWLPAFLY